MAGPRLSRALLAGALLASLTACGSGGGTGADSGPSDSGLIDLGDSDTGVDGGPDASSPDAAVGACSSWPARHRVHAHTRLWKVLAGTPEFGLEVQGLSELGATSFSRHVKTGAEDPWWPSAVPVVDGAPVLAGEPELVAPIGLRAEAAEMPFIAYYWHVADARLAGLHPAWVCRDLLGAPLDSGRGEQLDLTGPYREVLGRRLRELAERGARGVFLDVHHMPAEACFGTQLEADYLAAGGARPTTTAATDPLQRRFLAHQAAALEDSLGALRAEVCPDHDGFTFLLSAWTLPALYPGHTRATLLAHADSAKTEWDHALRDDWTGGAFGAELSAPSDTARLTFGWALLRDAGGGGPRPFHVYAPGLPDEAHARGFVAAVTAFGGVPILDVAETLILEDSGAGATKTSRADLAAAMGLGQRISDAMAGVEPERWAGVHFAEAARDARADADAAWREVLWPAVGAADALAAAGVPVSVVDDSTLDDAGLEGLRLLVLPSPADLSTEQREVVARFEARGGVVARDVGALGWGLGADAQTTFLESIDAALSAAPVALVDAAPGVRLIAHRRDDGVLLLAVVNGVGWVQPHGTRLPVPEGDVRSAPAPTAVRIVLRGSSAASAVDLLGDSRVTLTTTAEGVQLELAELRTLALVELR